MVTVCSWVVAGPATGTPVAGPATNGAQIPINPESDVGSLPRGPSPALGRQPGHRRDPQDAEDPVTNCLPDPDMGAVRAAPVRDNP